MNKDDFYQLFCQKMRILGQVKLKNLIAAANISEKEARKLLNQLKKENKIRQKGRGPSTSYLFG